MPFLDHLEELRWRVLWSLGALIVGAIVGFWLVQRFNLVHVISQPIAPHLPGGKLSVMRPTDAFMITLKLGMAIGLLLAAPVVAWQAWAFFSPALYEKEKRYIVPMLFASAILFAGGVAMAYLWVLPTALRILMGFNSGELNTIIGANEYFGFAIQLLLAFGVAFEVPLLIVLLAVLGVVDPAFFARHRRWAVVIAAVAAAVLSPGPDLASMLLLLLPLLLLYEIGILIARLLWRRARAETVTAVLLALLLSAALASPAGAQQRPPPTRDTTRAMADSTRRQSQDSAALRKLLPSGPSRRFPEADSIMRALLEKSGYRITRFVGDSLALLAQTNVIDLTGNALVDREGSVLEADTIKFLQAECLITAKGYPKLFDQGTTLIGLGMRYNTCEYRGFVDEALTNFNQGGTNWFLYGGLSIDSGSTRMYAGHARLTSSDLPIPDYHFGAGQIKWVNNNMMVARPAVLYVRDVPVMWLPFIFQDVRRGRRSGILIPRFGINDLVRPTRGYRRHVANVGYYVILGDYADVQASMDWFSSNYVSINGQFRYRWLNRFVNGGLSASRIYESGADGGAAGRSLRLMWNHQQAFDLNTRLTASIDYASSTRVVQRNALDPNLATANLRSSANFAKRYGWGTLSLGGSRTQDLTNGSVTQTLPNLGLTPAPINLSESITWEPSLTLNNTRSFNQPNGGVVDLPPVGGFPLVDSLRLSRRTTDLSFATPLRIGSWSWQNGLTLNDQISDQRDVVIIVDSADSTQSTTRTFGVDFSTGVDWTTSIGLPILLASTFKLQPQVGIQNSTSGPFFLRNRNTGGGFVHQGKRFSFGASMTPSLFGFFPGVGPLSRIRHTVSPIMRWSYAPAADVPLDYARALDPTGRRPITRSEATQVVSLALSQSIEGKFRLPAGDTTTDPANARKIKLLSLQTSAVEFDIEQAKLPGMTGWRTQTLNNQFTSDLLPGFSISMSHDLWEGTAGADTARFSPFLRSVSARFNISSRTVAGIAALFTGGAPPPPESPRDSIARPSPFGGPAASLSGPFAGAPRMGAGGGGRGFSASVTYDDQRPRPVAGAQPIVGPETGRNRTLGLQMGFSPTPNWTASWGTQYNMTTKEFGQHSVQLERDLRRWRATFAFVKAPNGNFGFNFLLTLLDQPDIRFDYEQQTIAR